MQVIIKTNLERTMRHAMLFIATALIFPATAIFIASFLSLPPTFATDLPTSVTIKPSLSISLPSSVVNLNLDPSNNDFGSNNTTITVATNNPNGYKLYLDTASSSGNNTDLVNTTNSSYTIPTLTNATSSLSFPVNYWGYKLDNANEESASTEYLPYTPNALISESLTATNGTTSTIDFAAKIDYTKPSGLYSLAFNLKTVPIVTQKYMQDIEPIDCVESPTIVMDKRDGHTYAIARLKDGKCWMVQNLRLGENLESVTGELILTDEDTDISTTDAYNPRSTFVLTNQVVDGRMPVKTVDGAVIWDGSAFYCTESYGCYYNFYTATAGAKAEGEGAVTARNVDVATTICPKGWTMPTGGDHRTTDYPNHNADFWQLVGAYGGSGSLGAKNLLVNPITVTENINGASVPGLLLGGGYNNNGANAIGVYARYWSRTVASATTSFNLSLTDTVIHIPFANGKADARSVRCLLSEL